MSYDKNFVDTPMDGVLEGCDPSHYKGDGSGVYDGLETGPFGSYKRTSSPNAVPEKMTDARIPSPSGEDDQFK